MGYGLKIEIQGTNNYNGLPFIFPFSGGLEVDSIGYTAKVTKTTDVNDSIGQQTIFADMPVYLKPVYGSDYIAFDLHDNPQNSRDAFGVGNHAGLGDAFYNVINLSVGQTFVTIGGENYIEVAKHSDYPGILGAVHNEDPANSKFDILTASSTNVGIADLITTGSWGNVVYMQVFIGEVQSEATYSQTNHLGDFLMANRTYNFPVPPGDTLIDCIQDTCSWPYPSLFNLSLDGFLLPPPAQQAADAGLNIQMYRTSEYVPFDDDDIPPMGYGLGTNTTSFFSYERYNTSFPSLENAGGEIVLENNVSVTPPGGSPPEVIAGITIPADGVSDLFASPLADGVWTTNLSREQPISYNPGSMIVGQDMGGNYFFPNYSGANALIINLDDGIPNSAALDINGMLFLMEPPITNNELYNYYDGDYNSLLSWYYNAIDFDIMNVGFLSSNNTFEINCQLDGTVLTYEAPSLVAGTVFGDVVCEILCCLKKLESRYQSNRLINPRIAARDKRKLDEAMVLVGLFEWAIKCNAEEKKINKYYKNILSVTGCTDCAGCD